MTEPPTVGPSDPGSAIHENWSDSDWEQWFSDEVEATDRWKEYAKNSDAGSAKKTAATNSETGVVEESVSETISHINKVRDVDDASNAEVFFPSRPPSARVFSHMTPDERRAFFEGWYRVNPFDPTLLGGDVSETFVAEGPNGHTMPGTEGGAVLPSEPVAHGDGTDAAATPGTSGWEDVPRPVDLDKDGIVDGTDQTVEDAWDSAVQDAAGSDRYGNRTIPPGFWDKLKVPALTTAAVVVAAATAYFTLGGPTVADPQPIVSEVVASAAADTECNVASGCSETDPDVIAEALNESECTVGADCNSEQGEETVEALTEESVDVEHDCAVDHQPNTTGVDGPTGDDNNSDAEVIPGSEIECSYWSTHASHLFIVTVDGDGESLSKQEHTTYSVSFIVNNEWPNNVYYDDTGFAVHVSWQHLAQGWAGQVFDSDHSIVKGASFEIEWLDESSFQVIVGFPGDDIEVSEVRTELDIYISDADDNHVYDHRDVAIWTAES